MFKYPLLAAFLALVACAAEKEAPTAAALPKVQLALNWFPEAEHGGLYAAAVHGYYEENGVEVEILGGGPDAPVVQRVATGAVAFGIGCHATAWYKKVKPTFADALAGVRKQIWATFSTTQPQDDMVKIPRTLFNRLIHTVCYAT